MQESDAIGFERAFRRLCAGFDSPPTEARKDAYWRAFRKLQLLEFTGLVDTALVESTFASMPTVGALRELHRKVQPDNGAASANDGPSVQAQLCEYVARRLSHLHKTTAYALPWTYVYREWNADGKHCAECTGVIVTLEDGSRLKFDVADMHGERAA